MPIEQKRALLIELLTKKAGQADVAYPLSHGQRALWFLYRLAPDSASYNYTIPSWLHHKLDLDVAALRRSFEKLIRRQACLRSTFGIQDGQLVQIVHPFAELHFEQTMVTGLSDDELLELAI